MEWGGDSENKKTEWAECKKTQGQEVLAFTIAIKALNDDDAHELFKKTLPSAASQPPRLSAPWP